jgi:predicted nucleotidyltransferase
MPSVVERVAAAHRPERLILHGSLARGDAGPDSDIDLLVECDHPVVKLASGIVSRRG